MKMSRDDVGDRVHFYRLAIAKELETLSEGDLCAQSWCEGWRVRDVFGHLVHMAEATSLSLIRELMVGGLAHNRVLADRARDLGQRPVAELSDRLRKAADGPRLRVPGIPTVVGVGEVMVHGNDALRPIGRDFAVKVDDVEPLLNVYRRKARMLFKQSAPKGVTLVAEDLSWSAGTGPEVRGSAVDLLLLLANRRLVIDRLSGPGLTMVG
jgi:uncharacterized protein (TIGR03083 family)